jgi:ankyrin repeat protein
MKLGNFRQVVLAVLAVGLCSGAEIGVEQPLLTAIRNNDLAGIKAMIARGVNVNAHGERGIPPVMYASAFGSVNALKLLLDAGGDVNSRDSLDASALMWSVTEPDKVDLLIARGADVNAKSKTGRTALMLAALHNGSDRVVDLLLAKGADVNAKDARGLTFLGAASAACNPQQVRIAVEHGLDVNAKDVSLGFTPLMNAAGNGDLESVKILLAHGADVNAVSAKDPINVLNGPIDLGYYTALMLASFYGPPEIVDALLHAGAKLDPKDIRGRTALHYAVSTEAQDPRIVSLLLKAGADPAVKDLTSQTAVDWAAKYAHPDVMRLFGGEAPSRKSPRTGDEKATVTTKEAVGRSLVLLQKVTGSFMENGGCIACHAQTLTALAAKYARPHGLALDEAALRKQFADHKAGFVNNGGRFLQRYDGGGGIDTLDYAMLYFEAVDYPADPMTDAILANMIGEQMANGSWIRGGAVQRAGPSPAARAPMQDSDIVRTALALRALKTYGWEGRKADLTSHIHDAEAWLLRAKPVYNEESAMQILALSGSDQSPNLSPNMSVVRKFAAKLIDQQRPDGGWPQNPYLESDSYATGETLFALHEAGILKTSDPVYEKGVQFLLRTQHEDGSWYVKSRAPKLQPYFQSGFPYDHDQWISMAGTQWATIALALSLR